MWTSLAPRPIIALRATEIVVLPTAAGEEETVMPTAPSHALLALNALIDELDTLRANQARISALDADPSPRITDARS